MKADLDLGLTGLEKRVLSAHRFDLLLRMVTSLGCRPKPFFSMGVGRFGRVLIEYAIQTCSTLSTCIS